MDEQTTTPDHQTTPGEFADAPASAEGTPSRTAPELQPAQASAAGDSAATEDVSGDDAPLALPDIDAALASVASLSDVLAEEEAVALAEQARLEAEQRAAEEEAVRRANHYYPRPPLVQIERGHTASVVAALMLIGVGAWLTLTLTTDGALPEPGLLALVLGGAFGTTLLAYWITSERWGRGSLFGGLTLLLTGGLVFFALRPDGLGADGWPLLIVAPGVALLLTALLSQPVSARLLFAGVLVVLIGVVALALTTGSVDPSLRDAAQTAWPFVLGGALVLLFMPALLARR